MSLARQAPGDALAFVGEVGASGSCVPSAEPRRLQTVFDEFTDSEEYTFDKTVVPLRLAQHEGEKLVSRSQAKRVAHRFERFKRVELDFTGAAESTQTGTSSCGVHGSPSRDSLLHNRIGGKGAWNSYPLPENSPMNARPPADPALLRPPVRNPLPPVPPGNIAD